jgi:succinate dehydrogenase/fumarate reductase flavoprotein subunit
VSKDFFEVRNIIEVADIIIESAMTRKESRGCHFREDYPQPDDDHFLGVTIVKKQQKPYLQDIKGA